MGRGYERPVKFLTEFAVLLVAVGLFGCATQLEGPSIATDPPVQNTLRWSTASELDNYGFDILRSIHEEGPFETINAQPIPGAGTTDLPQSYEYVHSSVQAGTAYFYYIESISMTGRRERATPTVRVVPTVPTKANIRLEPVEQIAPLLHQ